MGNEQEFLELLQHIAPDPEELLQRLRFLDWGQADNERLARHTQRVEPITQAFIDELYERLADYPAPAAILGNPATTARLKHSQADYYRRLWQGRPDQDYVLERLRIGWVHQCVGVDLKWYLGAYRLYLDRVLGELLGASPAADCFASLVKKVFLDIDLALESYGAAQRKALQDSEARYARAMRGANDGLWEWQLEQDQLYLSERWTSMLGLDRDSLAPTSQSWFGRVHGDDLPGLRQAIDNHLRGLSPSLHHEYRIRRRDGSYLWVLVRGVANTCSRGLRRIAGSQSDISQRRAAQEQLHHAARHDPLTGLANRARLGELLQQAVQRHQRPGAREAALLFIDLDRFKLINDSLGHQVGDRVLVEVAERFAHCLRPGDHLARFGGDEFVALLDDLACMGDAERVAQRMLDSLHPPLQLQEQTLAVSASIGIAALQERDQTLDPLQAADLALYRAKSAGKAQFARYCAELQQQAQRQLELQNALAQALVRDELRLVYQPICELDQGQVGLMGVEALLRWRHDGREVSPLEFIPCLEESGEILAVGDWVLRQACSQVRAWQLAGQTQLRCSVNLSSRQLQQGDFAARVADVLRETGLAPASLVLEITESQLMQDSAQNLACLRELASFGVQLALDDFGTGYSSLGYLKRFPLHIIKVDKSFIAGTPQDAEALAISRAIIGLGDSLGLTVVAEGVEQVQQLEFLAREGCRYAQGYWFSPPRAPQELQRLLSGEDRFDGLCCPLDSQTEAREVQP
ncbi:EAL domain-containing protein [Pseudomonas oleovorans]|uniref:Diguanylate cyclase DosC n=1 Tax=Ectopseudomonas oleovorans TaxID=301 RepID=A0AB35L1Z4_ECTOL|nr:EAL domain-containing protein [Pseudomonas oleovorans]MCR1827586.1 EAL domain-containing protein [Pseudomonas oleovorans]MDH0568054.1 EAL domain-containing protein [Pseudomonas oleovorans]